MPIAETLSQILCGSMLMVWILIASFSRTDESENRAQWAMTTLAICATASLIYLDLSGGSIWGSTYLPKPLAVLCIAFALLARLNIKGRTISPGMNPHQVRKKSQDGESVHLLRITRVGLC
ncbi:MAG: hypothetical protein VX906_00690, partial [Candidatus Thermoplasmatota archaeon]|nr:hypothetical protein [Candidatus Thermoplasmatota archaeon]